VKYDKRNINVGPFSFSAPGQQIQALSLRDLDLVIRDR
jgi:hypothetical protein